MTDDLKLVWNEDLQEFDISISDTGEQLENGLESAVIMSLFCDRRADPDDEVDNSDDLRGWWGDLVSETAFDTFGSKLWILARSKATQENLNLAKQYAEDALQWMIDDEIIAGVEVETERQGLANFILAMKVTILKKDGTDETFKYDDFWNAQVN